MCLVASLPSSLPRECFILLQKKRIRPRPLEELITKHSKWDFLWSALGYPAACLECSSTCSLDTLWCTHSCYMGFQVQFRVLIDIFKALGGMGWYGSDYLLVYIQWFLCMWQNGHTLGTLRVSSWWISGSMPFLSWCLSSETASHILLPPQDLDSLNS